MLTVGASVMSGIKTVLFKLGIPSQFTAGHENLWQLKCAILFHGHSVRERNGVRTFRWLVYGSSGLSPLFSRKKVYVTCCRYIFIEKDEFITRITLPLDITYLLISLLYAMFCCITNHSSVYYLLLNNTIPKVNKNNGNHSNDEEDDNVNYKKDNW